jgi:hypothetical protein
MADLINFIIYFVFWSLTVAITTSAFQGDVTAQIILVMGLSLYYTARDKVSELKEKSKTK